MPRTPVGNGDDRVGDKIWDGHAGLLPEQGGPWNTGDALQELFQVFARLGYRVTPPKFRIIQVIPRSLMAAGLGAFIGSDMMKLGMTDWSMSQTRDEWFYLGQELERIVEKNGLAVPAMRCLLA